MKPLHVQAIEAMRERAQNPTSIDPTRHIYTHKLREIADMLDKTGLYVDEVSFSSGYIEEPPELTIYSRLLEPRDDIEKFLNEVIISNVEPDRFHKISCSYQGVAFTLIISSITLPDEAVKSLMIASTNPSTLPNIQL